MTDYATNVEKCESIINYEFLNKDLCLEVLKTSGNGYHLRFGSEMKLVSKNDRLAVVGDAIVKVCLCERWFTSGRPKENWDEAAKALISNANLATVGAAYGLKKCVILNPGTTSVSDKTMATTMEAILGAVYRDGRNDALIMVLNTLKLDHDLLKPAGP